MSSSVTNGPTATAKPSSSDVPIVHNDEGHPMPSLVERHQPPLGLNQWLILGSRGFFVVVIIVVFWAQPLSQPWMGCVLRLLLCWALAWLSFTFLLLARNVVHNDGRLETPITFRSGLMLFQSTLCHSEAKLFGWSVAFVFITSILAWAVSHTTLVLFCAIFLLWAVFRAFSIPQKGDHPAGDGAANRANSGMGWWWWHKLKSLSRPTSPPAESNPNGQSPALDEDYVIIEPEIACASAAPVPATPSGSPPHPVGPVGPTEHARLLAAASTDSRAYLTSTQINESADHASRDGDPL